MNEAPPYRITPEIVSLIERIGEGIGRAEAAGVAQDLRLRRINHIRTIQGSLAIEGNTLSERQVATLLDGKPVVAPLREIQEARNAIKAYDRYEGWAPDSRSDLLSAHHVLMAGLLDAPGRYRRGEVMVGGEGVQHIGLPAARVPELMANLLQWIGSTEEHPLILTRWRDLFAHLPVESMVHAHQSAYYDVIRQNSAAGESTTFIAFMLEIIRLAVTEQT